MSQSSNVQSSSAGIAPVEHTRTGDSVDALKRALLDNLFFITARHPDVASPEDWYRALAYTVRDRMLQRWLTSSQTFKRQGARTVCYFSAEYLLGPHLGNNLLNLGIQDHVRDALRELGLDLEHLAEHEPEPGLGNGGLGRLAACFMDSLTTLQIPAIGYGIRYEFGIFEQQIKDGWQVERTDKWLATDNPWEIQRPHIRFQVKLGGHTEHYQDGAHRVRWVPTRVVNGIAYDTPILGYGVKNANLLRLFKAEATESFDFRAFNVGDYYRAVDEKVKSENITKVLYPNDEVLEGKQLRLEQQYFFVSCSLQDMLRIHLRRGHHPENFAAKFAVQLNDTHPAIAVAELMRLLVDEHGVNWEKAWETTRATFAYTNHTLLPEALETWPVPLFERVLPRHLEIIYEINRRFLDEVRARFPGEESRLSHVSLIDESCPRNVRMAHLACVGSHAINGVAALHTELLKRDVLHCFFELWPERFSNKTNGVTPRRFIAHSNPDLTDLIERRIDHDWIRHLEHLRALEQYAEDAGFQADWQRVKRGNKAKLARIIQRETGIVVDPESMFDVQVKRIHEYKRQHLNVMHIIQCYNRFKLNPNADLTPRTFIFGGKAAPSYWMAKLIIKLITSVGEVINNDPDIRDRLKVVFLPNYNVKLAQRIYPAADLSEQISLAGKEASGTGNMKFAMNGALTLGTLDGANVEIREAVGRENFFLFGLTADEVRDHKARGYQPWEYYHGNSELREVLNRLDSGEFSRGDSELFRPLMNSLLGRDEYMLLADFQSYVDRHDEVGCCFRHQAEWTRRSILNAARMGYFSSDRAIGEYCREIWEVDPMPVGE